MTGMILDPNLKLPYTLDSIWREGFEREDLGRGSSGREREEAEGGG